MFELRPYQRASIDALYTYFGKWDGNPCVVLPTGCGKSVVIAEFMRGVFASWPDSRILMVTHSRELILQNFQTLIRNWTAAPAGIYSAGLGRKDIHSPILCAGIQSIYRHAYKVQRCDLCIVDEAHLIPRDASTMYGKFLADLKSINPQMKIIGFTATPFRLDSGMLHKGEGALFNAIAYEMSILEAIEQGYLSEVVPKDTKTKLDVSGVGTLGGDFKKSELEKAVDLDPVTQAAVAEMVAYGTVPGAERRSWLTFAAGVDHAHHISEAIKGHGISSAVITGETPGAERDSIIRSYKAGDLRSLVNVSVLTTGFDAPGVDLIGMFRPTKSAGLFIQMIGRGTRLADGKQNCLLLDFAGNTQRHGPVDKIKVSAPGDGGGEAPIKTCPTCFTICYAGVRRCPQCDYEFPEPEVKLSAKAATNAVLSTQIEPTWVAVDEVEYHRHEKPGKQPSLRVEYHCGYTVHREWICFEHAGYARQKACAWWSRRSRSPVPASVSDALGVVETLPKPGRIAIRPEGRFTEIASYDFTVPLKVVPTREMVDLDEEIPF